MANWTHKMKDAPPLPSKNVPKGTKPLYVKCYGGPMCRQTKSKRGPAWGQLRFDDHVLVDTIPMGSFGQYELVQPEAGETHYQWVERLVL